MQQKFTPNHLIQYLYQETTICDTLAIEETLDLWYVTDINAGGEILIKERMELIRGL